jgi:uncharacterized protein (DUF169 family)
MERTEYLGDDDIRPATAGQPRDERGFMSSSNDYSKIARTLTGSLHLLQAPVAVCFTDFAPAEMKGPAGPVPAGCRFWQEAAESTFVTSAADHSRCAVGVHTHNLQPSPAQQKDLHDVLQVFSELGYLKADDIPLIPVLQSKPKHVVYAPLAKTTLPPDVVMFFVNASQTLILSEATQQVENQNPPAMGRPACAVIPQVMNSGRAALSLGCCGARAYLDVLADTVAVFALPGAKLEAYAQRIEILAKANAVLSKFHQIRRREIGAGQTPTIKDSLAALEQ